MAECREWANDAYGASPGRAHSPLGTTGVSVSAIRFTAIYLPNSPHIPGPWGVSPLLIPEGMRESGLSECLPLSYVLGSNYWHGPPPKPSPKV
jgi:hypothetical protein